MHQRAWPPWMFSEIQTRISELRKGNLCLGICKKLASLSTFRQNSALQKPDDQLILLAVVPLPSHFSFSKFSLQELVHFWLLQRSRFTSIFLWLTDLTISTRFISSTFRQTANRVLISHFRSTVLLPLALSSPASMLYKKSHETMLIAKPDALRRFLCLRILYNRKEKR